MSSSPELSPRQAHALFDVLTHHEVYSEIENFKWPDAIHQYGHPFAKDAAQPCTSPILRALLSKFALTLPGLSSVADVFWKERIQTIVEKLGAAELSESYDKGSVGMRKTLATAISALIEYPAKGALGGFPMKDVDAARSYDTSKPDDVMQAWDDFLQQLVYGGMIDELFTTCAETDNLEDHSPLVQAAHEFILVNLASLMHHILVVSPDGQAMLRILANLHKLVPYSIIRQTLKVGNAATMINGMVRLVLAKFSVSTLTNWVGISKNADEGMNLLQSIISTVLAWDASELQKQASKTEKTKEKDRPSDAHLEAIRSHLKLTREEREERRAKSVDLSAGLTDLENFLNDLIKVSKLPSPSKNKDKAKPPPTVEDFVKLLKKHQGSCHRFLHQIAKNGPEVTEWFRQTEFGPGMYIAKWLSLIESTPITPATTNGPLRSGKNKDVQEAAQIDVDGQKKGGIALEREPEGDLKIPEAPDVDGVIKLLGADYRKALAGGIAVST
ncbi:Px domain containing protein [Neofusicoccum parvum]|uniref:Putative px domain containing protein n=1 Tax=Botryosphaeria parva (strain UCR-NP2) TaxID=1287680 RepID=R1EYK6_BOTPV|nr:putative px domain containing protein [Neofusicoccum parvum UCRNP2]GME54067.1 Px domain containing protein [Neofusicoccum parvum]